jgi:hypothetical protein
LVQDFLKKRILMVIQVKIPFFEKFTTFVGNIFSMGLQPSCLWFEAPKASQLPLKWFGHQYGLLQLSSQNRTVRFLCFNSYPGWNLPLHSYFFPFLKNCPWRAPWTPWWRFFYSSMESWSSWVDSTLQEPVYLIPPLIFPLLKVFSPPRRSLCPMDRFKIRLVHCLHSCTRTTLQYFYVLLAKSIRFMT